jgi:hypothetical protein
MERFKQALWILGWVLLYAEAAWLLCSFFTLIALSFFQAGFQTIFAQRSIVHLASAVSFLTQSLLPGAAVGFLLLFDRLRKEGASVWLPSLLISIPLILVAQSMTLAVLFHLVRHEGSLIVMISSILWAALLTGGLLFKTKDKAVLMLTLATIALGVAWGIWTLLKFA